MDLGDYPLEHLMCELVELNEAPIEKVARRERVLLVLYWSFSWCTLTFW
jgi:hypothetical protein